MGIKLLRYAPFIFLVFSVSVQLVGQQNRTAPISDGFIGIASDARGTGQGDIGVATSADTFSQFRNASKYIFADTKSEIGVTQFFGNNNTFNEFSQLNFIFYNRPDERSAYALGFRNYAYIANDFAAFGNSNGTHEVAIDGSYALKLSNRFAMSVGGRFISLKGKATLFDGFNGESATNMYGIDISGFYHGNETAYNKFNGRLRAGFTFSNLRGRGPDDNSDIEIYAPSLLRAGAGFDFIFDLDHMLGITTEYTMLLDSYDVDANGEALDFGIDGSVLAVGFEFSYRERIVLRTGYSRGINRPTDTFFSLGSGFRGRFANVDLAFLLGLSEVENPIRQRLRLSLGLNLEEIF